AFMEVDAVDGAGDDDRLLIGQVERAILKAKLALHDPPSLGARARLKAGEALEPPRKSIELDAHRRRRALAVAVYSDAIELIGKVLVDLLRIRTFARGLIIAEVLKDFVSENAEGERIKFVAIITDRFEPFDIRKVPPKRA